MNTPVEINVVPFTVDLSEERFEELLDLTRLKPLWERIVETNPSGELPYHNNHHMKYMASIAMQFFLANWQGTDPHHRSTFGHRLLANLGAGCLGHDFAHTGGKQPDYINIRRTLAAYRTDLYKYSPPTVNPVLVESIITKSEFPYTGDPETFSDECVRDADMLYATLMGDPKIIMEGLRAEVEVSQGKAVTHQEMVEGQRKFLTGCKIYTPAGKYSAKLYQEQYLMSLEAYAKTLEA